MIGIALQIPDTRYGYKAIARSSLQARDPSSEHQMRYQSAYQMRYLSQSIRCPISQSFYQMALLLSISLSDALADMNQSIRCSISRSIRCAFSQCIRCAISQSIRWRYQSVYQIALTVSLSVGAVSLSEALCISPSDSLSVSLSDVAISVSLSDALSFNLS